VLRWLMNAGLADDAGSRAEILPGGSVSVCFAVRFPCCRGARDVAMSLAWGSPSSGRHAFL